MDEADAHTHYTGMVLGGYSDDFEYTKDQGYPTT